MFRFLHVGDEHNADMPPSVRLGSYRQDILAKEREIVELANTLRVDAVIRTGDIFHIKTPSKVSHGLVTQLTGIWQDLKCSNYAIIGNHDIRFDNYGTLQEQPLNEIIKAGAVTIIPEGPQAVCIYKEGFRVMASAVWGYGHPDLASGRHRYSMDRENPSDVNLKVCHSTLLPPTVRFPAGDWTNFDLVSDKGPDIFLVGHVHDYFGIHKHREAYLCMPGSICRGSINEIKSDRDVRVVDITIEERGRYTFNEIVLKSAKPAKDVFQAKSKRQVKAELLSADVQKYIEFMESTASAVKTFSLKGLVASTLKEGKITKAMADYLDSVFDRVGAR